MKNCLREQIWVRISWIVIAGVVAIALIASSFVLGIFVRSAKEDAIRNSKHTPEVTAEVTEHDFPAETVEISGTSALGKTWKVTVSGAAEGSIPVVTAVHAKPGDSITSGTKFADVSGRPLIALRLPFDLYRDLSEGDSGEDVKAVQSVLRDLGIYRGRIDGNYGAHTANAVKALYQRVHAAPPAAAAPTAADPAAKESEDAAPATAEVTPLPRNEIISLTSPSAILISVAAVNTHLDGDNPVASFRYGEPVAVGRVSVADKDVFKVGTTVTVTKAGETEPVTGVVTAVSEFKESDVESGVDLPGYDVTVRLDSEKLGDAANVSITAAAIQEAQTGLAIPITALREDDKTTYVTKVEGEERVRTEVAVSRVADGFALIVDGSLAQGDIVVVSE